MYPVAVAGPVHVRRIDVGESATALRFDGASGFVLLPVIFPLSLSLQAATARTVAKLANLRNARGDNDMCRGGG
jgi:hypothetical protein